VTPPTDPQTADGADLAVLRAAPGPAGLGLDLSLADPALAIWLTAPEGYSWLAHLATLRRAVWARRPEGVYLWLRLREGDAGPPPNAVLRLVRWRGERVPEEVYAAPLAGHLTPERQLALGPFPLPSEADVADYESLSRALAPAPAA
jgi:hypothetical protein